MRELEFVRTRSGVVHVVRPEDPDVEPEVFRFIEVPVDVLVDVALGKRPTLCGYVGRVNVHDEGVETFPDEALCRSCYRVLGDDAHLAFEHPQSDEEGDE